MVGKGIRAGLDIQGLARADGGPIPRLPRGQPQLFLPRPLQQIGTKRRTKAKAGRLRRLGKVGRLLQLSCDGLCRGLEARVEGVGIGLRGGADWHWRGE
ncbi:unnamed protein product [Phytomonas sp. Hart1]|nr:unnamed protein product [Phytomonas sp. Hart1]|eukprot:CCW70743.1 unnamed protein product [Phytomonas sp. isolate Hart1]